MWNRCSSFDRYEHIDRRQTDVILRLEDVRLRFGKVEVLAGVSFDVREGELLALIGPNGAGKTALLNCITGFYRPQSGQIAFYGQNIRRLPSHRIARLGIGRMFQNIALYRGASTLDNVLAGRHCHFRSSFLEDGFMIGRAYREEAAHRRAVEDILDFAEIQAIRHEHIATLPYGLRKRVELARALAVEPKLLLADEPMAGMTLEEKESMSRFLLDANQIKGVTILLVEHDMEVVMDIAERVCVIDSGRIIAMGTPQEVAKNPDVIRAYLGSE